MAQRAGILLSIDAEIHSRIRPARLGSFLNFYVLGRWSAARGDGEGVDVGGAEYHKGIVVSMGNLGPLCNV